MAVLEGLVTGSKFFHNIPEGVVEYLDDERNIRVGDEQKHGRTYELAKATGVIVTAFAYHYFSEKFNLKVNLSVVGNFLWPFAIPIYTNIMSLGTVISDCKRKKKYMRKKEN